LGTVFWTKTVVPERNCLCQSFLLRFRPKISENKADRCWPVFQAVSR
jgi:hypothetical protein